MRGPLVIVLVGLLLLLTSCPWLLDVDTQDGNSPVETYDLDPPLTPSAGGSYYTTQIPPPLSFSAAGGGIGVFRVRVNGGTWEIVTEPPPYYPSGVTGLGEYLFEVQERDSAGNWSESASFRFSVVSQLPPTPTVTHDGGLASGAFSNLGTQSWSWTDIQLVDPTADTNLYWRHSLDGTHWTETGGTGTTLGPLPDGSYTFFVEQQLRLGGWTARGSHNVTIDTVAPPVPDVKIGKPDGTFAAIGAARILHTATPTLQLIGRIGGGGDGRMAYDFGGGAQTGTPNEGALFALNLPTHPATGVLLAGERDPADNLAIGGTGVTLSYDSTAPTITGPTQTNNPRPTWTLTNTSAGSGTYEVTLSNSQRTLVYTTGATFRPGTAIPAGIGDPYTVTAAALDDYGFPSAGGSQPWQTEILPVGTILEVDVAPATISDTGSATFRVTANEAPPTDTVVNLRVSGTYEPEDLSGFYAAGSTFSEILPAGTTTVDIPVSALPDLGEYDAETVTVTIETGNDYSVGAVNSASLTITDSSPVPDVSMSYTGLPMIQDSGGAIFDINATVAPEVDTEIALGYLSGYDPARINLPAAVTLPAGTTFTTIYIDPIAGANYPDQYVEASILSGVGYQATGTPTRLLVFDDAAPTISYVGRWEFNGSLASGVGDMSSWSGSGATMGGGLYSLDGVYTSADPPRASIPSVSTSSITVAVRFRTPAGFTNRPIITGGMSTRWLDIRDSSGQLQYSFNNWDSQHDTGLPLTDGVFHTVVLTVTDPGNLAATIALNGRPFSANSTVPSLNIGGDTLLVSQNLSNGTAFLGDWDWVIVMNGAASYGQLMNYLGMAPW